MVKRTKNDFKKNQHKFSVGSKSLYSSIRMYAANSITHSSSFSSFANQSQKEHNQDDTSQKVAETTTTNLDTEPTPSSSSSSSEKTSDKNKPNKAHQDTSGNLNSSKSSTPLTRRKITPKRVDQSRKRGQAQANSAKLSSPVERNDNDATGDVSALDASNTSQNHTRLVLRNETTPGLKKSRWRVVFPERSPEVQQSMLEDIGGTITEEDLNYLQRIHDEEVNKSTYDSMKNITFGGHQSNPVHHRPNKRKQTKVSFKGEPASSSRQVKQEKTEPGEPSTGETFEQALMDFINDDVIETGIANRVQPVISKSRL